MSWRLFHPFAHGWITSQEAADVSNMQPKFGADGSREPQAPALRDRDLAGRRILIVDDQSLTGISMRILSEHLMEQNRADRDRIRRYSVFALRSPAGPLPLDLPPTGVVTGQIRGSLGPLHRAFRKTFGPL